MPLPIDDADLDDPAHAAAIAAVLDSSSRVSLQQLVYARFGFTDFVLGGEAVPTRLLSKRLTGA
jgi:hypothetical protein